MCEMLQDDVEHV